VAERYDSGRVLVRRLRRRVHRHAVVWPVSRLVRRNVTAGGVDGGIRYLRGCLSDRCHRNRISFTRSWLGELRDARREVVRCVARSVSRSTHRPMRPWHHRDAAGLPTQPLPRPSVSWWRPQGVGCGYERTQQIHRPRLSADHRKATTDNDRVARRYWCGSLAAPGLSNQRPLLPTAGD
jgi:hypothetical protein